LEAEDTLRETIRKPAESNYRHRKQLAEWASSAKYIRIEPWFDGMPDPKDLNVRGRKYMARLGRETGVL
jgi:elongation factor G